MKTKKWILILSVLLVGCIGLSAYLFRPRGAAAFAEIRSDGELIETVSLAVNREFEVPAPNGGSNTVTVRNGKIAVTAATCPDHICMDRGWCNQGTQIVCLPNRLIISFAGGSPEVDAIAG